MLSNVDARLKQVIHNIIMDCPIDSIQEDSDLYNDFGLDSILLVRLLVEVEEEFQINFVLEDFTSSITQYINLKNLIVEKGVS